MQSVHPITFQILPVLTNFSPPRPLCGLSTRHSKEVLENIPCGTPRSRFLGATLKGPRAKKMQWLSHVKDSQEPARARPAAADTSLQRQTDKGERKRAIDGSAWRPPRRQRKTEGLDRSGAEIKSQADLQPVCLLLLLLLLAPSYQPAEGSAPPPPPPRRQHSSPAPPAPLIVPSLMCPVRRNARRPALCHAPRGASRLAAPP